jgi:hypothetical protein
VTSPYSDGAQDRCLQWRSGDDPRPETSRDDHATALRGMPRGRAPRPSSRPPPRELRPPPQTRGRWPRSRGRRAVPVERTDPGRRERDGVRRSTGAPSNRGAPLARGGAQRDGGSSKQGGRLVAMPATERDLQRWARRGTTTERGLGADHRATKAALLRHLLRVGTLPCRRCGGAMVHPDLCCGGHCAACALDAGHGVARALGGDGSDSALEHRPCNRGAGARLGNRMRRRKRSTSLPQW